MIRQTRSRVLPRCLGIRRNVGISAKIFRGNWFGLYCGALWRKGFPLVAASILQSFLYCTIFNVLTPKRAFLQYWHLGIGMSVTQRAEEIWVFTRFAVHPSLLVGTVGLTQMKLIYLSVARRVMSLH